jgi:hypothetical protein
MKCENAAHAQRFWFHVLKWNENQNFLFLYGVAGRVAWFSMTHFPLFFLNPKKKENFLSFFLEKKVFFVFEQKSLSFFQSPLLFL